jgi:hypothetical protein
MNPDPFEAAVQGWLWQHDTMRDDLATRHAEHKASIEASGQRMSRFLASIPGGSSHG